MDLGSSGDVCGMQGCGELISNDICLERPVPKFSKDFRIPSGCSSVESRNPLGSLSPEPTFDNLD